MGQSGDSSPILEIRGLSKTFKLGLRLKSVRAVRDVSLQVTPGEAFGFLGPNGAGKTTTMKMCMGLIRPTSGEIRLFGQPHTELESRKRLGFLPEQPYFYDYLKPTEILDLYGRLFGLDAKTRRDRSHRLLERLGLDHAKGRTLRKFSKGMLQRLGLAQALLNDPELIILDEPLSGLDPIGRKQIRDLLLELRAEGKTLFFSSHILNDIEMVCDRVAIIHNGKVVRRGPLSELLHTESQVFEIVFRQASEAALAEVERQCQRVQVHGSSYHALVRGRPEPVLAVLTQGGALIDGVSPKRESLEDLFMASAGEEAA